MLMAFQQCNFIELRERLRWWRSQGGEWTTHWLKGHVDRQKRQPSTYTVAEQYNIAADDKLAAWAGARAPLELTSAVPAGCVGGRGCVDKMWRDNPGVGGDKIINPRRGSQRGAVTLLAPPSDAPGGGAPSRSRLGSTGGCSTRPTKAGGGCNGHFPNTIVVGSPPLP